MQVSEHVDAGTVVLTLVGKMDFHARQAFHHAIEKARLVQPKQVILNLSHVPFIDSAGLGLLMLAHKSLTESKTSLLLEVPRGYVMDVLNLANIRKTIAISVTEAQSSPSGFPRLDPTTGAN